MTKNIIKGQYISENKRILAKQFRQEMTPTEKIIWEKVRDNRLGAKFRRQQIIAGFIADFYCHSASLAIEIDGATHDAVADAERDAIFAGLGIQILRITNQEIYANLQKVEEKIQTTIDQNLPSQPPINNTK